MPDTRTTVINLSLPASLLALADARAKEEARTRSDLFREAVRRYLGISTVGTAITRSNRADSPNGPSARFDGQRNLHQVPADHARERADITPDHDRTIEERDPSWRVFRILAEFIDGFDFLEQFNRTVTVFGSARSEIGSEHYQQAVELGTTLARAGFTIITGGGPGIMEAANRGAVGGGGESVGLNIQLPNEQRSNPFVQRSIAFNYFFARKVMMNISAWAYVFFPGGFGTLDEFFELVTLEQTGKVERHVPIVLVGSEFWEPLCQWLRRYVLARGAIDSADLELWTVVDSVDEAVRIIQRSRPRPPRLYQ